MSGLQVLIRTLKPIRAAGIAHRGPWTTISDTWGTAVCDAMAQPDFTHPGLRVFSLFVQVPPDTPQEEWLSYCCCEIPEDYTPPPPWEIVEVPGRQYAAGIYQGPHTEVPAFWGALCEGLEQMGRPRVKGDCFEVYLNDPGENPPEEWLTEVNVPVD